jgi:hypothetical protein
LHPTWFYIKPPNLTLFWATWFYLFCIFSKNIYIFLFYCPTPISNPKPLNKEQGYPPSTWLWNVYTRGRESILNYCIEHNICMFQLGLPNPALQAAKPPHVGCTCSSACISQTPSCQLYQGWQWGIPKNIFLVITSNGFRWIPIS